MRRAARDQGCGTDEFESRPPEEGQRDKFGDAGRIHELPRVAPALPVRRHLAGEFLYAAPTKIRLIKSFRIIAVSSRALDACGHRGTAKGLLVESLVGALSRRPPQWSGQRLGRLFVAVIFVAELRGAVSSR